MTNARAFLESGAMGATSRRVPAWNLRHPDGAGPLPMEGMRAEMLAVLRRLVHFCRGCFSAVRLVLRLRRTPEFRQVCHLNLHEVGEPAGKGRHERLAGSDAVLDAGVQVAAYQAEVLAGVKVAYPSLQLHPRLAVEGW